ncbi:iron-containing alcohol dehydrogenase [Dickeya fangzhongdai]|uniref:iron-containing alcohol dehydrogenase n=1 Tax=Dickeya fangzhongdai TaxID=1778540 RepID=UPI0004F5D258|nr:iron-containing alcohol dehydrogenase [Dickeya fangzhongdai]AIR71500.1 aldehyde reductase [Dickeya fangzhongdai]KGT98526.1 aldehyde reductase [Dickeya fangzhongdai]
MLDFEYFNPTRILFGPGKLTEIVKYIPENARILITYGGDSARKYGTLDEIRQILTHYTCFEFGGIEPNPQYATLMRAVDVVKANKIDFLLAIGGGSVVDGTKFIAAASAQDDIWNTWLARAPIQSALPIGCVMTLPATGSEMNATAVVSHKQSGAKAGYSHPLLFPRFAVLDPRKSYTLPSRQVANGVVDAFVHVLEQYLTYPVYGKVQDRFAEGLLLTLIEEGPKAILAPENYDVRATLTWSATLALNGLIGAGVPQDWATHRIGHQLTSLFGLDHAQTLAVLLPSLLDVQRRTKHDKLVQYAHRVWNLTAADEESLISLAIEKTREFFETMGVKTRMRDYNLPESAIDDILANLDKFHLLPQGEHQDIDRAVAHRILRQSY